jgi:hypothetical protein
LLVEVFDSLLLEVFRFFKVIHVRRDWGGLLGQRACRDPKHRKPCEVKHFVRPVPCHGRLLSLTFPF